MSEMPSFEWIALGLIWIVLAFLFGYAFASYQWRKDLERLEKRDAE